jgi:hypothetical protein
MRFRAEVSVIDISRQYVLRITVKCAAVRELADMLERLQSQGFVPLEQPRKWKNARRGPHNPRRPHLIISQVLTKTLWPVIYAVNTANAVQAAKAATSEIPIVFANGIGPSACRGVVRHRHIPSCHHYRVLSTPGPNRSR